MSHQNTTSGPSNLPTYPTPKYLPGPYSHSPAFSVIAFPDDTKDEPPPYASPPPPLPPAPQLPYRPYIPIIPKFHGKRRKLHLALTIFLLMILVVVTGVIIRGLYHSQLPKPTPTPTTTPAPNVTVTETITTISTTRVYDPPPSIDPDSGSDLETSKALHSGPIPTTLMSQYTGSWVTSVVLHTVTAPVPLQTLASLVVVTAPTLQISLTPAEPMTAPLWVTSTA
ncbi:uncharacterized protein BDZ99DRAFT_522124 [Mytilinidion resinicola]|uniref:Uncharacterized protein n=1 Tax=Mytilinidion resinicola TaxID=574789 RepID=A0A6A6YKT6_9PEZI|nr:uncharacterized protein BDZ99DRAFT_522124 [Mytilinidion resinicola]KAF2808585.1 hypothetical protein BDZ99DRAFT_522124 [Mytilinidion resinicola]